MTNHNMEETLTPTGIRYVDFCFYVDIPTGFQPAYEEDGLPDIDSAIVSNCTFLYNGTKHTTCMCDNNSLMCTVKLPTKNILGNIKIQHAVEIIEEFGVLNVVGEQETYMCSSNCLCINEELCVGCPGEVITEPTITMEIDKSKFVIYHIEDFMNKKLYRVEGKVKITFTCPSSCQTVEESNNHDYSCMNESNFPGFQEVKPSKRKRKLEGLEFLF